MRKYYLCNLSLYTVYSNDHFIFNNFLFYSVYLAAHKTKCRYVINGTQCAGKPVLKCLRCHDETTPPSYFIGCSEWKMNKKYHQFISIKDNVDLNLLSQLLNGMYEARYNF